MNKEKNRERKEEFCENITNRNTLIFFKALKQPSTINNGSKKIDSKDALEKRIFAKSKCVCYITRN